MVEYDRLGISWRPYIMYFHTPNFVSPVVNTDSFGFRLTPHGTKSVSPLNIGPDQICNLIVGGSTAFGVGADTDNGTIAAHLSKNTGDVWLNFAGRAFSAFQEFSLFASFQKYVTKVNRIVIISGFNNLYLAQRNLPFEMPLGAFFFQQAFESAMVKGGRRAAIRSLLRRPKADHQSTTRTMTSAIELAVESTRHSLELWRALALAKGAKLVFALQPTAVWSERRESSHEKELFEFLSAIDHNLASTLRRLDLTCYQSYRQALLAMTQELQISFLDLNDHMRSLRDDADWHYVDRVHYTSIGYQRVAEAVTSGL